MVSEKPSSLKLSKGVTMKSVLAVCLFATLSAAACSKKSKESPAPEKKQDNTVSEKAKEPETSPKVDPLPPAVLPTEAPSACTTLSADSESLTKELQKICLASGVGKRQVSLKMLIRFGEDVRVVAGGNADSSSNGLTRDVSQLLSVKSSGELKSLICLTHQDLGASSQTRNDLFDFFDVKYLSGSQEWNGDVQSSGEISAAVVDTTVCAPERADDDFALLQVIVSQ